MDEKSKLNDELVAEFKQEPEILDMTPLASIKSILRQALGYDDLTPIDLTKHISVALRSSSGSNAIAEREADSDILRFFASGEYPAVSLKVSIVPVQEGTGDPAPDNVRTITGWTAVKVYQAAEYDEEAEPVIEVALGDDAGTVYGGTLDVITGVLSVDMAVSDLGSASWSKSGTRFFTSGYAAVIGKPANNGAITRGLCDKYASIDYGSAYSGSKNGIAVAATPAGSAGQVSIRDSALEDMTAADFKTYITGAQFVYPLAEPLIFEIDHEELSTLIGENNIWADCGPVESITY